MGPVIILCVQNVFNVLVGDLMFSGLLRRFFRYCVEWRLRHQAYTRQSGRHRLFGYGLQMAYCDEQIWLNQILEIFCRDCYGVGKLPLTPRVIDCGANMGTFSLFLAWLRPCAEVVMVEPSKENLSYLESNMAQMKSLNFRVIPMAVGAAKGSTKLGGLFSDSFRTGLVQGEEVDAFPLSDLLQENVDLLKIDVEGAEYEALTGAGAALKNVVRVIVEAHDYSDRSVDFAKIFEILQNAGFNRFRIYDHRDFRPEFKDLPTHCCLLEAWRT